MDIFIMYIWILSYEQMIYFIYYYIFNHMNIIKLSLFCEGVWCDIMHTKIRNFIELQLEIVTLNCIEPNCIIKFDKLAESCDENSDTDCTHTCTIGRN